MIKVLSTSPLETTILVHPEADRSSPLSWFSSRSHPQKGRTSIKKTVYSLHTFGIFFVSPSVWMFLVNVLWSLVWFAAIYSQRCVFNHTNPEICHSLIHISSDPLKLWEDEWKLRYFAFTMLCTTRLNITPLRPFSIYLQLPAGQLTHPFPCSVKWPAAGNTTAALLARRGSQEILIPSPTSPDNTGSTDQEIHSETLSYTLCSAQSVFHLSQDVVKYY